MWETERRGDRAWLERHLADDFAEVGRTGKRFTREDILADLDVGPMAYELHDLAVHAIAGDVALVTYRSVGEGTNVHRSSIWRREDGTWRLAYHQGTPVG